MAGIIKSTFKAFFVAFAAVMGLLFGFIFLLTVAVGLFYVATKKDSDGRIETILPDARWSRTVLPKTAPALLVLDIEGVVGLDQLSSDKILEQLLKSREDNFKRDRVKGILLRINTGGGGVFESDRIYRMLQKYKTRYKTPVYAYVDGLCASGGVWIASAADKIYATNTSFIGSVGVLSGHFNFSKGLEKLGVQSLTLTAGKDKDTLNPLRPWKPDEEESVQEMINFIYKRFIDLVVTSRPGIDRDKLVNEYGANVYNAPDALTKGYIDGIVTDEGEVLKALAAAAGIPENKKYQVVNLESIPWTEELFGSEGFLRQLTISHEITSRTAFSEL